MLKRLLLTALVVTLAAGVSYANPSNAKVTIPVNRTAPNSGQQMFNSYCATCHGADARGNGPVAQQLKSQPPDLTVLARNNHGKFPDAHIVSVLQYGSEWPTHGTVQMPVWGPILGKMNQSNPQERMLRVSNLSRYLETLQVK